MQRGLPKPWSLQSWRTLLSAGVAALAVLATAAAMWCGADDVAIRSWRAELAQASADELPAVFERIAASDRDAIPLLIELLDDDRRGVADGAGDALHAKLAQWRQLPLEDSLPRIDDFAEQLAQAVARFRSPGRFAAAQFADALLSWPTGRHHAHSMEYLTHCETILRASGHQPGALFESMDDVPASLASLSSENSVGDFPIPFRSPVLEAGSGANLSQPIIAPPLDDDEPPPTAQVAPLPPVIADAYDQNPPAEDEEMNVAPPRIYAPLAIPLDISTRESGPAVLQQREPPGDARASNAPADIQEVPQPAISSRDDMAVMRMLHDPDDAVAAADELTRRGFDALRLAIARRLTHPDAEVRKQLAGDLPQISGIDARVWLEQLAADNDPSVRRIAIGIIATDASVEVDAWLDQRRRNEPDAGIAQWIGETLDKRR